MDWPLYATSLSVAAAKVTATAADTLNGISLFRDDAVTAANVVTIQGLDDKDLETIHQEWVATLDGIRDAVFVLDEKLRIVRANRAFADLARDDVVNVVGRPLTDVLPWLELDEDDGPSDRFVSSDDQLFRLRTCLQSSGPIHRLLILEDVTDQNALRRAEGLFRTGTRRYLAKTVEALARALETKDPYTMAHCFRVANLSSAIAERLEYAPDDVECVGYGALLHDIGSLGVPSGILSRPSGLTKAEFNLIKMHVEVGHSITKSLSLPWPIHEIIQQHHERMDGSGYPLGLKGDQIDKAARIVAVADVVEAMSSHRPYRPALGFDAAVSEIVSGKGEKYDADVVDALVSEFDERGEELFERA